MMEPRVERLMNIAQRLADAEWGRWDEQSQDGCRWVRPPWKMGNFWPDLIRDARDCAERPLSEITNETGE